MSNSSTLKIGLGGKVSGRRLKRSHDSASKALTSKIEGKRKDARKHRDEKVRTGLNLFN